MGIWGVGAGTAALFVRLDSMLLLFLYVLISKTVIIRYPSGEEGPSRKHSGGEVRSVVQWFSSLIVSLTISCDGHNVSLGNTTRTKHLLRTSHSE